MAALLRATRTHPCPICGKPDYCSMSSTQDLVLCYRTAPLPDPWRCLKEGDSATGHFRVCVLPNVSRSCKTAGSTSLPAASPEIAPPWLSAVYTAWWDTLILAPSHQHLLTARGLSATAQAIYRTWPAARTDQEVSLNTLAAQWGSVLATVPGFIHKSGRWICTARPGLLIPVYTPDGQIAGVKCRPDTVQANQSKYYWLSSEKHGGPGAKATASLPPWPAHQPPPTWDVLRLTEGELKAHSVQEATNIPTISAPGVGAWAQAWQMAQHLWNRAHIPLDRRTLLIAWDQDVPSNSWVTASRDACTQAAQRNGVTVFWETWDPVFGKGLDDVLRHHPATVVQRTTPPALVTPHISSGSAAALIYSGQTWAQTVAPALTFALPGLLRGTVGSLVGPGGLGKSWVALQLLVWLTGGPDTLGWHHAMSHPLVPAPWLYISLEDPAVIVHTRIRTLQKAWHIPDAVWNRQSYVLPSPGALNLLDDSSLPLLTEWIARTSSAGIIVDTFSRAHHGDENKAQDMVQVLQHCEQLAQQTGATIVFVHHTSKAATLLGHGALPQAARGSSVLTDHIRWQANLSAPSDTEWAALTTWGYSRDTAVIRRLTVPKANYGSPPAPCWLLQQPGGWLQGLNISPSGTTGVQIATESLASSSTPEENDYAY